jgi:aminoglycoside 2'-N-acetyltransferase I
MVTLHTASSDALSSPLLAELRAMLDVAYEGDFSDQDWQHLLGGTHVWLTGPDDAVVSHAALVERVLECSGQPLRVGYVEAVATAKAHRRAGYGTAVMHHIASFIHGRYPLGALSTGEANFYSALGWERWRGETFVNAPHGRVRTPDDDGGIMILRTLRSPALDLDGPIVCDWRPGDVW